MRNFLILASLAAAAAPAWGTPVSRAALDGIYSSCVRSFNGPQGQAPRYCGCFRNEVQARFTAESVAVWEDRQRRNALTAGDTEIVNKMVRLCRDQLR